MKNILNTIKTLLLTGVITVFTIIPALADSNDLNIVTHYTNTQNEIVTVFKDGTSYTNCDVNIISNSYIDNSLTVEKKDGQQYKFYVDDAHNYYLDEEINVTFNDKMEIVDCLVLSEPQVYNTEISQIEGDTATLIVNGDKYTFENTEGQDGWQIGDKCKVIIQDGRLLEVNPIPLNER